MLRRLLISWAILAVALALAAWLLPDVEIHGGILALIGLAALYGLVNALIGTVLRLLTLPLTVVTLGLSALGVNALLLAITAGVSDVLDLGGFLQTVAAVVLISIFTSVLHFLFLRKHGRARKEEKHAGARM